MRWCLLLFILSPVILFGQARRQAMVDSVKAAGTNLHGVFGSIGNSPGSRVEHVHVSDSGEYVTLVVRVHVDEPVVVADLPLLAATTMGTAAIIEKMNAVIVPPLPVIRIPDSIMALSLVGISEIKTSGVAIAKMGRVGVPPMPNIPVEIEAAPLMAVTQLSIQAVAFRKLDMTIIPWLPHIVEEIEALSLLSVAPLKIKGGVVRELELTPVPWLPHIVEEIEALSCLPVAPIRIEEGVARSLDTVVVFAMPEIEDPLEAIPFFDVVLLPIEKVVVSKLDLVPVPALEEERMPVEEMHLSEEGYSLLEKMEGFSPELYSLKDGGFTIGFGFFVPYGEGAKWNKGVTWEEAERIIRQKVPSYEDQVKQYINVPLTQREFDALTMLAYNLGGFSRATSIVNDINGRADYEQLQHDWMRFVHSKAPNVMKGLMNRRKDELLVSNESNYQPERKIQVFKSRK